MHIEEFADGLESCRPQLLALARTLARPEEVEDLVQTTLMTAWAVRNRPRRTLLPWLKAILRNLVVDEARRPVRFTVLRETDAAADLLGNVIPFPLPNPRPAA